ncbi:MAG: extracellular solute-binding protein [Chloroflexi bacterium]|nr:extracellular solute-binding protein [Chloroflexota bacterium]
MKNHRLRPFAPILLLLTGYWLLATLLVGCTPETPRMITLTAQAEATPTLTPAPLVLKVETPTPLPGSQVETITGETFDTLTVWVNETSPEHAAALQNMADEFVAQHQIQVQFQMVMPDLLPDLVASAVLSATLPDLILHPVEYTVGWAEAGVLDSDAATAVLNELGAETFDAAALEFVARDNLYAALPAYGWKQIILYRADRYAAQGLAAPDNFEAMLAGAAAFYNAETLQSGLVVPTESDLITTQQIFEMLAMANGCDLVDTKGEVFFLHPACLDTLDFYREIINQFSPSDVQTDISALNAYLNGQTSLIIASPSVLPIIGGVDPARRPTCAECTSADYLAQNSGILTSIQGRSQFAETGSFSELTYLGITTNANAAAAALFANYWFNEGYLHWLAVNPEQKVPLRLGTPAEPTQYIDAWRTFPLVENGPTMVELFGDEVAAALSQNVADSTRWGFRQGQGQLITDLYEGKLFSILLQEMLSGYFNTSVAVIEGYKRIIALIPNYAYTIELEPTPTATPFRR